jgi:hypothetical protein
MDLIRTSFFCRGSIRQGVLCINGIHEKQVQRSNENQQCGVNYGIEFPSLTVHADESIVYTIFPT